MRSFVAKPHEVERKWYVIDAEGKNLGRLSSEVASILRGKKKPIFTPHVDCGDYVIIVNAEKVEVTGNKRDEKTYDSYSGYPGGLKKVPFKVMQAKRPEEIIRHAVRGMMPKGKLGREMYKKLRVYAGPEHNHQAQQPEVWNF
ncbi:MAG: 50S ribosomal protein L13 [Bacillota bacterium]|nr:50S ribosomal protein L13 [Bacillota bacterium]